MLLKLKSSFRRSSDVGVGIVGCKQKVSVVRERKFKTNAKKENKYRRLKWESNLELLRGKQVLYQTSTLVNEAASE